MKCDICHKRDATVHLTEVVNDDVTKLHLCEHCAKEKSEEMQAHFGLTDLLSGLMDFTPVLDGEETAIAADQKCSVCGMTYYDIKSTGKLGCGMCYEQFSKNISEILKKIHGSDRHVGKIPGKGTPGSSEKVDIGKLKEELQELISNEEFEDAAVLRDHVKNLEQKAKGKVGKDEN